MANDTKPIPRITNLENEAKSIGDTEAAKVKAGASVETDVEVHNTDNVYDKAASGGRCA